MRCRICRKTIPKYNSNGNYMRPAIRKRRKTCSDECALKNRAKTFSRKKGKKKYSSTKREPANISVQFIKVPERVWRNFPIIEWNTYVNLGGMKSE